MADSGVKFAWIKATEGGDHLDENFQANWQGAKLAGMPHGAYHFVYWCRPPIEEATWFEQNVPVEDDALPPVLDVEATPEFAHLQAPSRTRTRRIADMKVMLEEMERHFGKRPIIYTSVDFYEAILSDGAFTDYPIWVRSTKHHPSVRYGVAQLAFLAIPVRRRDARHRRPRRPQRLLRRRASNGRRFSTGRSERERQFAVAKFRSGVTDEIGLRTRPFDKRRIPPPTSTASP